MSDEPPSLLDDILEAALLAAGEPLSLERFEVLFDDHERPPRQHLRDALERVSERHEGGAMEMLQTASGYQLRIRPRLSPWVSRLWDERPQRYSRALLETLALIAYRQPVTRGDIEEVRGVAVSGSIMRTLLERNWVRVVGHRDMPGRPAVYATTRSFLDDLGLKTLDELPPMHELKALEEEFAEEEAAPPPQHELLAQADAPLDEDDEDLDESRDENLDEETEDTQPATAGMADDPHAGTASERTPLSFADLQTRLSERARTERKVGDNDHDQKEAHDDADATSTESTTSENDDQ